MPKVIVIQTAGAASTICARIAQELGLGADKVVISSVVDESIEIKYIQPGEEQLIVTGTHYGSKQAADEYVRHLKEKNPLLRAWFCSLMVNGEPPLYERSFDRDNHRSYYERYKYIMEEVKKFIDGLLPLPG